MIDVYYYIPENMVEGIIGCGLKLSEWAEREVMINGETRKCIPALLSPKDDMIKYRSSGFVCLKIAVAPNNCYVADRFLYEAAQFCPSALGLYEKSVLPVEKYSFGTYRLPECLLYNTLLADQIRVADKRIDTPVIVENSEKLYINNIMETYREENECFNDILLYNFYNKLAEFKIIDKIEDKEKRIALFLDNKHNRTFCVRIPGDKEIELILNK